MEQQPKREESTEKVSVFDTLRTRVASFTEQLKAKRETGFGLDPKRKERLTTAARKTGKVASYAALAMALGLTLNHMRTRYEISDVRGPEGEVTYSHQDERTTQILDFLTGKAELAPEDRVYFYRQALHEKFGGADNAELGLPPLPDNLDDLDEAALFKLAVDTFTIEDEILVPEESRDEALGWLPPEERATRLFADAISAPVAYDPELERIIWELQERVGSPMIRWAAEGEGTLAGIMAQYAGRGRAFYDPLTNTVYLTPGDPSQVLAAEDAHSVQFNDRPVQAYSRAVGDSALTLIRSLRTGQSYRDSYMEEYNRYGSLEHEAHKFIEPGIVKDIIEEGEEVERSRE